MLYYKPLTTFASVSSLQKTNTFTSPRLEYSQKIIDSNFALYSPQRKTNTNNNKSKYMTYKNQIELRAPVNLFNYKTHQSVKVQRQLHSLNKTYNKDTMPKQNLRNRPVLNLDRGEFDFTHQCLLSPSPTHKIMVSPVQSKRIGDNRNYISYGKGNRHLMVNLVTEQNKQHNRDEFTAFMNQLTRKKKW